MFVGEPKRLTQLIPDPFLLQIPNILILGIVCFCDCGCQRVIEAKQRLCDCWHRGVIQAGQPGLMQGADEVNVGFGVHLSLCVWGSMRH